MQNIIIDSWDLMYRNLLRSRKTEDMFRNILFFLPICGNEIVRIANRSRFVSDLQTLVDNILIKLFGESQVCVIVQKTK